MFCRMVLLVFLAFTASVVAVASAPAQTAPLDLWTGAKAKIRDRSTLNPQVIAKAGYFEVYYDSEADAKWADWTEPYKVHTGGKIRIHGYLASPMTGGPYASLVMGHGHGGHASPEEAIALAALGYVVLAIDGPGQGSSTGPPDTEQGWISVEQVKNQPSPEVGYLYHYAYAGMRGLTLLERLSTMWLNPFRIDRSRLGVIGASMGGQFTYYINGVDDRVKGAVAIAVAGGWHEVLFYPGAWLYHGLYYYTRDGLISGQDHLNTISNVCTDPTLFTFMNYFDPISYAPTQNGPLLTIIGTHDQFFTVPAINVTYDRTRSAGTSARFLHRIMIKPNGKHGVLRDGAIYSDLGQFIDNVDAFLKFCFKGGAPPASTPTVSMEAIGDTLQFRAAVTPGGSPIQSVRLYYATQIDSTPADPQDFTSIPLTLIGTDYVGTIAIGSLPPSGPPATPDNVVYLVSVKDGSGATITSKIYYGYQEMAFGQGFVPIIEHWYRDTLPVPPPPVCPE